MILPSGFRLLTTSIRRSSNLPLPIVNDGKPVILLGLLCTMSTKAAVKPLWPASNAKQ